MKSIRLSLIVYVLVLLTGALGAISWFSYRTTADSLRERLALQELCDRIGDSGVHPDVVDRQDVGVRQRRDEPGFALESGQGLRVGEHGLREHLDGDVALEPRVPRAVDFPHPSGAERRDDLVRTETGAGRERHRRIIGFATWDRGLGPQPPAVKKSLTLCMSSQTSFLCLGERRRKAG